MFASTSFVTPTGENLSSCGYCKSKHSSASYGIWAYRLTCEDYQRFINRGWRRSGVYLYKPNQRDSCCAAYAIRLDVSQFQLRKARRSSSKTKSNSGQSPIDTLEQMIKDAESDTDKSFTIELKQSCNDKDTFELYKKYQTVIHHDDPEEITEHQFTRFLVDSPLEFEEKQGWSVPGLGSFHQKYYYDGQLVAVAVLDILPQCVSSVY
ncbi:arginine-tRNA-protein transferase [Syncephalis plumigaleata]|nr:arginine-tRNA-protein transferase [Syncephalis plumigaleata]